MGSDEGPNDRTSPEDRGVDMEDKWFGIITTFILLFWIVVIIVGLLVLAHFHII
jgi:heme/copper-type cytochrome/quinol oxidase subunit 2